MDKKIEEKPVFNNDGLTAVQKLQDPDSLSIGEAASILNWSNELTESLSYRTDRDEELPRIIKAAESILKPWEYVGDSTGFTFFTPLEISRACGLSPEKVLRLLVELQGIITLGDKEYCLEPDVDVYVDDRTGKKKFDPQDNDANVWFKKLDKRANYKSKLPGSRVVIKAREEPGKLENLVLKQLTRNCKIRLVEYDELQKEEPKNVKIPDSLRQLAGLKFSENESTFSKQYTRNEFNRKIAQYYRTLISLSQKLSEDNIANIVTFAALSNGVLGEILEENVLIRSMVDSITKGDAFRIIVLDCLRWKSDENGFSVIPNMDDDYVTIDGETTLFSGESDVDELKEQVKLQRIASSLGLSVNTVILYADTDVKYVEKAPVPRNDIQSYIQAVREGSDELGVDITTNSVLAYLTELLGEEELDNKVSEIANTIYNNYVDGNEISLKPYGLQICDIQRQMDRFFKEYGASYQNTSEYLARYKKDNKVLSRISWQIATEVILMQDLTSTSDLLVIPTKSGKLWGRSKTALRSVALPSVASTLYKRRKSKFKPQKP